MRPETAQTTERLRSAFWCAGLLALATLFSGTSHAVAQTFPDSGPKLLIPEEIATDNIGPAEPHLDTRQAHLDYWIVGSRTCPQMGTPDDRCLTFEKRCGTCGHLKRRTREEFFQSLPPGRPICFVIHGSFVHRESWLQESDETLRWLRSQSADFNAHVVFFTWPSDSQVTYILPLDIAMLGRRSAYNSLYLGKLIAQLPPDHPVSLIGHSHGGRLAVSTAHLLSGGEVHGYEIPGGTIPPRRLRLVLAAAALDHHWLNPGERYERAVTGSEGLLNLHNSTDSALLFYPLRKPLGYAALGASGLHQQDRLQLGPWSSRVTDIEVSPLVGGGHLWPDYVEQQGLARTVSDFVSFAPRVSGLPSTNTNEPGWTSPNLDAQTQILSNRWSMTDFNGTKVVPGINLKVDLPPRR